jgi:hypothetical protein
MRGLFITPILWLALALSAYGRIMYRPITPDNSAKDKGYLFTVTTEAAKDDVVFHVTITSKKGDIPPDSTVFLEIITFTKEGDVGSGESPKTEIPVTVKKDKKVLEADFSVSREQLKETGLCLEFPVDLYDDYVIKLHDFLKK